MGGGMGEQGKKEEGSSQGTSITDKNNGEKIEYERGWVGQGRVMGEMVSTVTEQ